MKILLLQPPIEDFYDTSIRLQPVGLGYLKAAVKKFLPETEVTIKDFHQGYGRKTIPIPKELAYLSEYYPFPDQSPFSLFYQYYHFGASFEEVAEEVAREKPDLVGISSLFTPYYREVLHCADRIKSRLGCPVLIGGPQAAAAPDLMLSHPSVEWVIRGEGEWPLVELIRVLTQGGDLGKVPNLGYKNEGRLIWNPIEPPLPLEGLPPPDISDLDSGAYTYEKRPLSVMMTSRGCPWRCAFCSVHQTFADYRRRRPAEVLKEMALRFEQGYRVFDFEDDNLTYPVKEAKDLFRKIIRTFPAGQVRLMAMNGLHYRELDEELLFLMKQAGFSQLNLSLVSANPAVLRLARRPSDLNRYLEAVETAFQIGFKLVSYQILGLPFEDVDSMIRTLILQARLPVRIGASPFYGIPGTPLAPFPGEVREEDLIRARLTALGPPDHQGHRETIYTLLGLIRMINFLKGLSFDEEAISLRKALELAGKRGKREGLGAEILERLFSDRCLYGWDRSGFRPLPRFNTHLFFDIWPRLTDIKTQEGKTIRIH